MQGLIFDIQKFSIHDGPGIRTTVFLKGCPLSCFWCHNPESRSPSPQISFIADQCIGCGQCFDVCPVGAHVMTDGRHQLRRDTCQVCGRCVDKCYTRAVELVGRQMSVDQVLDEVVKDIPFYKTSGGGMTLSGGEPTLQIDFIEALLHQAKAAGLHCCIETSGHCDYTRLERILPDVDLWLFDWKESDPVRHREYCGVDNTRILANLRRLHADGAMIRLRCPIIPTFNDRADHFQTIARITRELPHLEGVELMPYHRLGQGKSARLGLMPEKTVSPDTPSPQLVQHWITTLRDLGVHVLTDDARPPAA